MFDRLRNTWRTFTDHRPVEVTEADQMVSESLDNARRAIGRHYETRKRRNELTGRIRPYKRESLMHEGEGDQDQGNSGQLSGGTPSLSLDDAFPVGDKDPEEWRLDEESFKRILAEVHERCFLSKGRRHSDGSFAEDDMWDILRQAGYGFPHGQVMKKWAEFQRNAGAVDAEYQLLDVCVYTILAILWERRADANR